MTAFRRFFETMLITNYANFFEYTGFPKAWHMFPFPSLLKFVPFL